MPKNLNSNRLSLLIGEIVNKIKFKVNPSVKHGESVSQIEQIFKNMGFLYHLR